MKHIRRSMTLTATVAALLAVALCSIPFVAHGEFAKRVSIAGGSPAPQISAALSTAGYLGGSQLDELTIKNPSANANSLYLGSSSTVTSTTGFELAPGVSITYRSGARAVDASRLYLFTSSTQNAEITLRER